MSKKKSSLHFQDSYKRSKKQSTTETYTQRAQALFRENQPDAAIKLLKKAISLSPYEASLYHELSKLFIKSRQLQQGNNALEQALKIDPYFLPALVELGQIHSSDNAFDEAIPLLKKALATAPNSPQVHLVYGTAKQRQGELPEAVEHLRKALELNINHPIAVSPPQKKKEDFDKPETEALMWDTLSLLAKAGVHAFASYGTLLGIVREGGLLPFDKDIDLGIPDSEIEYASQCLKNNGWVEEQSPFLTNPRSFVHPRKGITLDLSGFVVDSHTGETYSGFWIKDIPFEWNRTTKYITIELKKDVSPTGQPLWALRNPEVWLETIYGTWQVPDPYFDTVIAAKNLCGFSLLTQCYAFSRIFSHWEKGNLLKALSIIEHSLNHLPDDAILHKAKQKISKISGKQ